MITENCKNDIRYMKTNLLSIVIKFISKTYQIGKILAKKLLNTNSFRVFLHLQYFTKFCFITYLFIYKWRMYSNIFIWLQLAVYTIMFQICILLKFIHLFANIFKIMIYAFICILVFTYLWIHFFQDMLFWKLGSIMPLAIIQRLPKSNLKLTSWVVFENFGLKNYFLRNYFFQVILVTKNLKNYSICKSQIWHRWMTSFDIWHCYYCWGHPLQRKLWTQHLRLSNYSQYPIGLEC